MLSKYNREQFKINQLSNDNYKDFLNEKDDDPAGDDDKTPSFEEESWSI